jgi:putative ABC transport system substrate-binding protein
MRRREFIAGLGAAAAWPLAAQAQQQRMRRVGALMAHLETAAIGKAYAAAFEQGLASRGWTIGRDIAIDCRWNIADPETARTATADLLRLTPDAILAHAAEAMNAVQQATRTVPVVFAGVADPVGAGFVNSLARPGGNATGFTSYEYSLSGKWLDLLKEIAPSVKRVAVLRDPAISAGTGQFAAIQTAAQSLGVELSAVNVHDALEIESAIGAFARAGNGGLIVTTSAAVLAHRDLIIDLAARHKLPAIYYAGFWVAGGGLASYGPDYVSQYRRAAGYVDRILKGSKPADLPVEAPTTYELCINLRTAKALGLAVTPALLARATEVIE